MEAGEKFVIVFLYSQKCLCHVTAEYDTVETRDCERAGTPL